MIKKLKIRMPISKFNRKDYEDREEYFFFKSFLESTLGIGVKFSCEKEIYLMEDREALKIGKSYNHAERFKNHKSSNIFAKIVKVYQSDDGLETYLHNRLSDSLVEGEREWFHMYDGIYEDIDKYVETYERLREYTDFDWASLKGYPYKMFKFKERGGKDYAFVIAKSEEKAREILLKESFLEVVCQGSKDLNEIETIGELYFGKQYIYQSSLKTRLEYRYCVNRGINFYKEYGTKASPRKTKEEIERYMTAYNERANYVSKKERTYWQNRNARAIKRFYR